MVDPEILEQRAAALDIVVQLKEFSEGDELPAEPGTLLFSPHHCPGPVKPGELQKDNQHYVLETIRSATSGCLEGRFDAMVTGPVNKAAINQAGFPFSGHTEFIAEICKVNQPVMVLDNGKFRVALLTTHIPLASVSSCITRDRVEKVINVVDQGLKENYGIRQPTIVVCGLNPHAGEMGELGNEETQEIIPALQELKSQGVMISGPVPADTAFTENALKDVDIVVAMYHDQGLPVLKSHGFGDAVNITFGLPIIRTSVDHGTALELAGTGLADAGSLEQAIKQAVSIASARSKA